jgi:hypothetical protein
MNEVLRLQLNDKGGFKTKFALKITFFHSDVIIKFVTSVGACYQIKRLNDHTIIDVWSLLM